MPKIIFEVQEAAEGGYWARALGHSIFTQGETGDELREMAKNTVACHFEGQIEQPKIIRLLPRR